MPNRLFLLPSLLGEQDPQEVLPTSYLKKIEAIRVFFVEEIRTTRRFLRKVGYNVDFAEVTFIVLNEHTTSDNIEEILQQQDIPLHVLQEDMGVLSEAGLPCVADPGSKVVAWAHRKKIPVVPLSGPSSLFLALMASGFNGQKFAFNGYLPVDKIERAKKIRHFETLAFQEGQSQIFIETPYRNEALFDAFLKNCKPHTLLCVAKNISLENEEIRSMSISEWKKEDIDLKKQNTVFILSA